MKDQLWGLHALWLFMEDTKQNPNKSEVIVSRKQSVELCTEYFLSNLYLSSI